MEDVPMYADIQRRKLNAEDTVTTSVAASTSSVTLLAASLNRAGFTIFNNSTANLFVKFGATASTSSFTVKIAAGGYYESPYVFNYTGVVDGIWDAADGNAQITEV